VFSRLFARIDRDRAESSHSLNPFVFPRIFFIFFVFFLALHPALRGSVRFDSDG
jgi:hypothetical protein